MFKMMVDHVKITKSVIASKLVFVGKILPQSYLILGVVIDALEIIYKKVNEIAKIFLIIYSYCSYLYESDLY